MEVRQSTDPHPETASGHKVKHHCGRMAPMHLRDGRNIWITFEVCEVKAPLMCGRNSHHARTARIRLGSFENHYALDCWIELGGVMVMAPVSLGDSSGSAADLVRDVQREGAHDTYSFIAETTDAMLRHLCPSERQDGHRPARSELLVVILVDCSVAGSQSRTTTL